MEMIKPGYTGEVFANAHSIIANNYILYPYLALFFEGAPKLEIPPDMWALLKIGLGGYVVGRSVEKAVIGLKKPNG